MFWAILRKLLKREGIYWTRLFWVLKQEWGEDADFPHFHFLVAGLPPEAVHKQNCRQIREDWLRVGGGYSRVQPYDSTLSGRDYVLKNTGEKSGIARSFLGDLEDTGGLMLSESAKAFLKRSS